MKTSYTQSEVDEISAKLPVRDGWDFSFMKTAKQTPPWTYIEVIKKYLKSSDSVLDVGTGGGEFLTKLSPYFDKAIGIDIDPEMIAVANRNGAGIGNVSFQVMDDNLVSLVGIFDIILCRHAPYNLEAVKKYLKPGGYFITQQVGEKNMGNIKSATGQGTNTPSITKSEFTDNGFDIVEFLEYDIDHIVLDIESLVFWLNALDALHADMIGKKITDDVSILNQILDGNVDDRGFITNEQRYLVVAQLKD